MPFNSNASAPAAKSQRTDRITSTQSWTVPADVSQIEIILCGGGAGGAGMDSAGGSHSGAGGSGSAEKAVLTVTPGSTHTITIGAGGGTIAWNATPTAGGASSFGSLLTVDGGYNIGWGGNNNASWALISGRQGGKNGGKGSRIFGRSGYQDATAGNQVFVPAEKGIDGLGGGGGAGSPKVYALSVFTYWNNNGADGGGCGGSQFYNGSAWVGIASTAGAANTGAGGGGGYIADATVNPSNGGSGVAIIKYWSAL